MGPKAMKKDEPCVRCWHGKAFHEGQTCKARFDWGPCYCRGYLSAKDVERLQAKASASSRRRKRKR